jgi:hypothetical protein
VQDYFYKKGWTDGLPITPPTEKKVKEMLKGTSHSPDEVVTSLMHPEELTVTVEKTAVVGVMAGCRPEYMPVLLAIIEAHGSPMFTHTARSESSFSIMTFLNGPIRNEYRQISESCGHLLGRLCAQGEQYERFRLTDQIQFLLSRV